MKNTFVEIGAVAAEDGDPCKSRLKLSDASGVQGTSPYMGAHLQPGCEAAWGEQGMLASPAVKYMPDTPSPFLHPAAVDSNILNQMGLNSMGFCGEMVLPPAFGDGDGFGMGLPPAFDGQDMSGFYGVPAMMYDPASGSYTTCGWCMPLDALQQTGSGEGEGGCNPMPNGEMALEALMDGQVVSFDGDGPSEGGQPWSPEQGMPLEGQPIPMQEVLPEGWNPETGMPMDQQGPMMEMMQENQGWGPDGSMPMDQGCPMGDGMMDSQGWNPDGGMPGMEQGGMLDVMQDGQAWADGLPIEGCPMGDATSDGQGWANADVQGALCPEQQLPGSGGSGKEGFGDGQGWNADGESGRAWRGKGKRDRKERQQQQDGASTPVSDGQATPPSSGGDLQSSGGDVQSSPGGYTTVMLRNIPNKYTREMLVKQLSQEFRGRFDFVYLPIDFKNRCNVGYGFINFRTGEACDEFVTKFNGVDVRKCLPGLNSRKVAEVTPARVQGLDENVRRLRNGPVMNELVHHPEWMPLLLDEDGEERPFPCPDQPCPPVKPRRRAGGSREEHTPGCSSGSGGGNRGGW